jgi:flagellar motor component MotA
MISALELLKIPGAAERIKCNAEDKSSIKKTIELILEMTQVSRDQGLLALKAYSDKVENVLLKNGLLLITEGTEPEYVYLLLATALIADSSTGAPFLENLIIIEGVLAIQRGNHPEIIRTLLNNWLYGIHDWTNTLQQIYNS